jgi:5-methylcytosine-specific restriction protein A
VSSAPVSWYTNRRWLRRRKLQLAEHPLCVLCLARGAITPANVVDHIERHNGDWTRFWTGPLQSLCEACHNRDKQFQERRGYARDIGLDGLPLDPRHPVRRRA